MGRRKKTSKRSRAKTILRLPDLEQSRNAVLNSLAAASSQESYALSAGDEDVARSQKHATQCTKTSRRFTRRSSCSPEE
jgi:hypothetical protein